MKALAIIACLILLAASMIYFLFASIHLLDPLVGEWSWPLSVIIIACSGAATAILAYAANRPPRP